LGPTDVARAEGDAVSSDMFDLEQDELLESGVRDLAEALDELEADLEPGELTVWLETFRGMS
jgi:hypothetical protein